VSSSQFQKVSRNLAAVQHLTIFNWCFCVFRDIAERSVWLADSGRVSTVCSAAAW